MISTIKRVHCWLRVRSCHLLTYISNLCK